MKRCSCKGRHFIWFASDIGVPAEKSVFNARIIILPQVKRADSYHGRADAFEATFERSYLAFQLHCRGVQALRQSLLEKGSVSSAGGPCPDPDADASDAAATQKSGRGSQAASDACSPEGYAEAHLLRTLGAQLAELVTARECEKLVRIRLGPLELAIAVRTNRFRIGYRLNCRGSTQRRQVLGYMHQQL